MENVCKCSMIKVTVTATSPPQYIVCKVPECEGLGGLSLISLRMALVGLAIPQKLSSYFFSLTFPQCFLANNVLNKFFWKASGTEINQSSIAGKVHYKLCKPAKVIWSKCSRKLEANEHQLQNRYT